VLFAGVPIMDHYAVLGVDVIATRAEIAQRYKQLALQFHPDRNKDSSASMIADNKIRLNVSS